LQARYYRRRRRRLALAPRRATAEQGLKRSTAVFRGTVIEISHPFLDRIGLTRTGGHRVMFEVIKQRKGAPSKTVEVITRLTAEGCGFPFEEKKSIWSML
jgi:hypothetical protein